MPSLPASPVRNYIAYGDCLTPARPLSDDEESPEDPPSHDDVADQRPIAERGWNVIDGHDH